MVADIIGMPMPTDRRDTVAVSIDQWNSIYFVWLDKISTPLTIDAECHKEISRHARRDDALVAGRKLADQLGCQLHDRTDPFGGMAA